jgi:hypothetical protein
VLVGDPAGNSWCAVAGGDCVLTDAVDAVVNACILNADSSGCAVAGGDCVFTTIWFRLLSRPRTWPTGCQPSTPWLAPAAPRTTVPLPAVRLAAPWMSLAPAARQMPSLFLSLCARSRPRCQAHSRTSYPHGSGCTVNDISDWTTEVADMRWDIPAATQDIILDGDLSDWDGVPYMAQTPFRPCDSDEAACATTPFVEFDICSICVSEEVTYFGALDHSIAESFNWTADALYYGSKVYDDTHKNQASGWNGDSVQLMFTDSARRAATVATTGRARTPTPRSGPSGAFKRP